MPKPKGIIKIYEASVALIWSVRSKSEGIKTAKMTAKTGKLIVSKIVSESDSEIIAISKNAQVIRTALDGVPSLGRQTQGVRIMKLREGDSIASLTCL